MTNTLPETVEVIQADRDAAWPFRPEGNGYRAAWDAGAFDELPIIRAFARHRQQAVAEERWLPIETAPKDGTHILLADDVEQYVAQGFWEEDGGGFWCRANEHWTDAHDVELSGMTHWQPLPAPPAIRTPSTASSEQETPA